MCTWCLRDERSSLGDEIFDRCLRSYAVAPALWPTELINALWTAERKQRVTRLELDFFLRQLSSFDIRLYPASLTHSLRALDLARSENLTVYDASYLALAEQLDLPLATFDRAFKNAAQNRKIAVF